MIYTIMVNTKNIGRLMIIFINMVQMNMQFSMRCCCNYFKVSTTIDLNQPHKSLQNCFMLLCTFLQMSGPTVETTPVDKEFSATAREWRRNKKNKVL